MKERLSKVYLDGHPVTLMGDESSPPLSRIVRAGGKRPDHVDVVILAASSDKRGRPVEPEEIIDRTAEPTRPIYLRTIPHDVKPIYTADPGHTLSRPEVRKALALDSSVPDVDPVIAQLGAERSQDRRAHEEAVFRAPSQFPPDTLLDTAATGPATTGAARKAEAQAKAEAAAEQRQEDERNNEDALQDEAEAMQEADEDAEAER